MDFFARQEAARKRTGLLVFLFALALLAIIAAVYLVVVVILVGGGSRTPEGVPIPLFQPGLLLPVAIGISLVVLLGSLYKSAQLAGGGDSVAKMMGARRVEPSTRELHERRLLNIVEEMAIASGIGVPAVYVMDEEKSINAFAAGYRPSEAVVCVTRGTLDLLNRDELQGVIAHEFSHILNHDMRLNIRLIGILHGLLLIALIGYWTLRTMGRGRGDGKGKAVALVIGLALLIIGYAGVFFGRMIKAAVSRQREFLADASAVQFTRNPQGLSGALKKIGGWMRGSKIRHPAAEEASHMFFGEGVSFSLGSLLSTHPPLVERIRRIEPAFAGEFQPVGAHAADDRGAAAGESEGVVSGIAPPPIPIPLRRSGPPPLPPPMPVRVAVESGRVMGSIGEVGAEQVEQARRILAALPPHLRDAAREADGARAVVLTLLLDADETVRGHQLEETRRRMSGPVAAGVAELWPLVAVLPREARLPLLDLAMPALRALSAADYDAFVETANTLMLADDQITLFEYAISRILERVQESRKGAPRPAQVYGARGVGTEISALLSVLARLGQAEPEEAAQAFAHGASALGGDGARLEFLAVEASGLDAADAALQHLAAASPALKRGVLAACLNTLMFDGTITTDEHELFRAVAAALDCPVPPGLAAA